MPLQVQVHMNAIHELIEICRRSGVVLSDNIKRAIFWLASSIEKSSIFSDASNRQDLNAAALTGSIRVADHRTFPELQWSRGPSDPSALPLGFQRLSDHLSSEFTDVLRDIFALQCIRDSEFFDKEGTMSMAHIDNHQASIQSRLIGLPPCSAMAQCCHLGAYLCSAMLRCKLWRTSTTPVSISVKASNYTLTLIY